jgi:hypothetical protein
MSSFQKRTSGDHFIILLTRFNFHRPKVTSVHRSACLLPLFLRYIFSFNLNLIFRDTCLLDFPIVKILRGIVLLSAPIYASPPEGGELFSQLYRDKREQLRSNTGT